MPSRTHRYDAVVTWTGNLGSGTSHYREYGRDHEVTGGEGRTPIFGSADRAFRGDPSRWNPEQLLIASLSQCHMLWYLHLAADAGVIVTGYVDRAGGTVVEEADGRGQFLEVVLRPDVTVAAPAMIGPAHDAHDRVAEVCFIARSVTFPVRHEATVRLDAPT